MISSIRLVWVYAEGEPATTDIECPLAGQAVALPLGGATLEDAVRGMPIALVVVVREDPLGDGDPAKMQTKHRLTIEANPTSSLRWPESQLTEVVPGSRCPTAVGGTLCGRSDRPRPVCTADA